MSEIRKTNRVEKLKEAGIDVAKPGDSGYKPPSRGGCWICNRDDSDDMEFDTEFDTFYHKECLDKVGCGSILEYERKY